MTEKRLNYQSADHVPARDMSWKTVFMLWLSVKSLHTIVREKGKLTPYAMLWSATRYARRPLCASVFTNLLGLSKEIMIRSSIQPSS